MLIKNKINRPKHGHTYIQWMVAILANTTLLTYGLQTGWVSPMTKLLRSNQSPTGKPLTDNEVTWIASTMCLSAVFSVPMYAYIADIYGRRVCVITIAVFQALCWIIKLCSATTLSLIIARTCCGIAAGGCFNIIPMYVKEISEDNIRGLLGSLLILVQNIGILAMYAMGSYLDYYTVLWIVVGVPMVTALLMMKAPESPAFLVKIGKINEATSTVAYLRGLSAEDKSIQNEVNSMKNENLYYKTLPDISFSIILKKKSWRRLLFLGMLTITVASCNGNFAIVTYASTILTSSGVTFSPELQALSFPVVMILGSFASLSCVEKMGRKPLLATSFAITVISLVCLGTTLLVQNQGISVPGWIPVLSLVTSLFAHAAGVSPIPYIIMSEMYNFQIRAKVTGCIVTYAWFISFAQLLFFGPVSNMVGPHMVFYFFAAVNFLGVLVTLVLLPETKGKTVEEIEIVLRKK